MDQIARFNKRRQALSNIKDRKGLTIAADPALVASFLQSSTDTQIFEDVTSKVAIKYDFNVDASDHEIDELLSSIAANYDKEKFNNLFTACRDSVISSIVGPFGIGKLVALKDREGGNVTTVHNARQGIYADSKDEYRRKDYTNSRNSDGRSFAGNSTKSVGSEFTRSQLDQNGNLRDAYTGKRELASNTSPDHIVSCSETHKEGMFMLSNERKSDFATDKGNLASTRRDINQSKSDDDLMEWQANKQAGRDEANGTHFAVDPKLVKKQYEKGKLAAEKHMPNTADKAKYYVKNTAQTGVNEGVKMGMQQAIGLLLSEFYQATFDEIMDIYRNGFAGGFEDDRFFIVLNERLSRISKKIAMKWKDACEAFTSGFLSGFLSNIVTTVINTLVTTSKRVVRIIREGFFSLLKAIKLLCDPPEGMSLSQAAHEASKIIATGLVVTIGVLVEQKISEFLGSLPFADIITTALIGGMTGLATTFIVYMIDKVDLFRVNARERHQFIMEKLDSNLENLIIKADSLLKDINRQPLLIGA